MNKLTIDFKNGNSTTYQLIEDKGNLPIAYNEKTNKQVIDALEYCRKNKIRIKLNLGDTETGKSWNEENCTTGRVGLSKGSEARFPILVHNERSFGGSSILDNRILQIKESNGKRIFYTAKNFIPSTFEIKESKQNGFTHSVYVNGELYSNHKTERAAKLLIKKLS
jgi:hypothetical protein